MPRMLPLTLLLACAAPAAWAGSDWVNPDTGGAWQGAAAARQPATTTAPTAYPAADAMELPTEHPPYPRYAQSPPGDLTWGWQTQVYFDLNQAKLLQDDLIALDRIAAAMDRYPEISLVLTGHTDNTGDADYNQALSARRSDTVAAYLERRGADPERILKRFVGEGRPVAGNTCDEDRRRNRRVDIAFYPTGAEPPPPEDALRGDSSPDPSLERERCR